MTSIDYDAYGNPYEVSPGADFVMVDPDDWSESQRGESPERAKERALVEDLSTAMREANAALIELERVRSSERAAVRAHDRKLKQFHAAQAAYHGYIRENRLGGNPS